MKNIATILKNTLFVAIGILVLTGILSNTFSSEKEPEVKEVIYSELLKTMDKNEDKKMVLAEKDSGVVMLKIGEGKEVYVTQVPKENKLNEYIEKYEIEYKRVEEEPTLLDGISSFIMLLLPLVLIFFVVSMILAQRKQMGKAKSMTTNSKQNEVPSVKMEDIGGLSPETKREIHGMIETFKNAEDAEKFGIRPLKGAIFHGPPGTGKTLLAKAVAHELEASFFAMSGSGFTEMFVGVGASRVRNLFEEARKNAPALIFIDEVDAIAGKRGGQVRNDEREGTLNELLTQLDGVQSNEKVMVLVATNRLDMLDDAFIRAGRFDLKVMIDLPDLEGRKEIIKIHTKTKPLAKDVLDKLDDLAKDTYGYSGAEIEGMFLTAATNAFNLKKKEIDMEDIDYAIERTLLGSAGRKLTREDTKIRVAYHEAGHALISALSKPGSIRKATIAPRGQAYGFVSYTPDEMSLSTYSDLFKRVQSILAGGLGEMVKFKEHSMGVGGDVQQAKQLIEQMVDLGMGDGDFALTFNEKSKSEKMQKIYNDALLQCKNTLEKYKDRHEALTQALLERETLDGKEVEDIVYNRLTAEEEIEEEIEEKVEDEDKNETKTSEE